MKLSDSDQPVVRWLDKNQVLRDQDITRKVVQHYGTFDSYGLKKVECPECSDRCLGSKEIYRREFEYWVVASGTNPLVQ